MSASVPGSWSAKLLAGNARIVNPSARLAVYRACSASYCGVNPHFEATFTTSTTSSAYSASVPTDPSVLLKVISRRSGIVSRLGQVVPVASPCAARRPHNSSLRCRASAARPIRDPRYILQLHAARDATVDVDDRPGGEARRGTGQV